MLCHFFSPTRTFVVRDKTTDVAFREGPGFETQCSAILHDEGDYLLKAQAFVLRITSDYVHIDRYSVTVGLAVSLKASCIPD